MAGKFTSYLLMNKNLRLGEQGEKLALQYLQSMGYLVLETNWRTGHKEIDIICQQYDVYIFVEVKSRRSVKTGMPEESISDKKIKSVTEAALVYLQNKKYIDIRFDVISIIYDANNQHKLLHIKDAFY